MPSPAWDPHSRLGTDPRPPNNPVHLLRTLHPSLDTAPHLSLPSSSLHPSSIPALPPQSLRLPFVSCTPSPSLSPALSVLPLSIPWSPPRPPHPTCVPALSRPCPRRTALSLCPRRLAVPPGDGPCQEARGRGDTGTWHSRGLGDTVGELPAHPSPPPGTGTPDGRTPPPSPRALTGAAEPGGPAGLRSRERPRDGTASSGGAGPGCGHGSPHPRRGARPRLGPPRHRGARPWAWGDPRGPTQRPPPAPRPTAPGGTGPGSGSSPIPARSESG